MDWNYFDKFDKITDKYMPPRGEGETVATQIVTAVNKLVYKWYNDGDVFDNTGYLDGWCNDLSSYANWLYKNTEGGQVLFDIFKCHNDDDYENLLAKLADKLLVEEDLEEKNKLPKVGSIYECGGPFRFVEINEDDGDEYDEEYEEDEEDEEEF